MPYNKKKVLIAGLIFTAISSVVLMYRYAVISGLDLPEPFKRGEEFMINDKTIHSIDPSEILSGGVAKDGIPSIDNPKFTSAKEADKVLEPNSIGIGFAWKGEARFYPYDILVWHEIVNDTIQGDPILISYCPLCFTGIVFERKVKGEKQEFGVSGKLWMSNLLMYNRDPSPENETLWSQVLAEGILGSYVGEKLKILPSDIVDYNKWKEKHPNTKVLSRDTGVTRIYGADPYGNYYTSDKVSFGATFEDTRLHPKELVAGVGVDGKYKAYHLNAIEIGETEDIFSGKKIIIKKDEQDELRFALENSEPLPHIISFWFAWLAVHPETELFQ